mmetsp:Transcript_85335/g.246690  ORF Transcript_85335/g.246690 Transcript_85335/m.246690 type:complete len:210 (+) Transcript_85335:387-1016(+)
MHETPVASTATLPRVTCGNDTSTNDSSHEDTRKATASRARASRRASQDKPMSGSAMTTNDGRNSQEIVFVTVILSDSQSIVVVTSPIGLQAPPALAAITISPPILCRRCRSLPTECRSNFRHTIVAVRLSMTALMKKHNVPSMGINSSLRPRVNLLIVTVTTAKPSKWSMDSTTPIAGSRKRMMAPTSCKPCFNWWSSSSCPFRFSCGW